MDKQNEPNYKELYIEAISAMIEAEEILSSVIKHCERETCRDYTAAPRLKSRQLHFD